MSLIIFSHANSFPASTYGVLFKSLRARGFSVRAPEKFGHDPAYPVTSNWPHLVQQLADFAAPEIEAHGQGAWLVGQGHAWSMRWHNNPGPYAVQETAARKARRGLFKEAQPESPRDFRRRNGPCQAGALPHTAQPG